MTQVKADVKLVRHTPDAEELLASAAKLCYAKNADTILKQDKQKAESFVSRLLSMGHMSPVEHISFTFLLAGVSRAMTHQLVRHRMASYSQRSQRYVDHDRFDYVIPPQFAGKTVKTPDGQSHDAVAYFADTMSMIAARYAALNDCLGRKGESSNEDSRYVLPNACETRIFVTMNARELIHFFNERLCNRSQWEIRNVADKMLSLVKNVAPSVFEGIGPKCVKAGKCTEGKMGCGHYADKKEKYGKKS